MRSFENAVDDAMLAEQLREQVKGAQVSFTVLARLRQELREAHARWEEKR